VVWFGEGLSVESLHRAERAASEARLVIVAGTSSLVYPAASLPLVARRAGAFVVEVNPEPTPLTPTADEHYAAAAGEVLPLMARAAGVEGDA
jgi:NAD-dependent deacetylase